ncbi:MAG: class II glutamine amidotransferase [Steroidobacteraceae bacterium]
MCGIVGLLIKKPEWRDRLGELAVPMLIGMTDRGPDSAGLAVFTEPTAADRFKLSVYAGTEAVDWDLMLKELTASWPGDHSLRVVANHAVLTTSADPEAMTKLIKSRWPGLNVLSVGHSIDLYKETGAPATVAERYGFRDLRGTHVVAHTRMATESAVTPAHAHPFTAGHDFCLVHNGSLSNPYMVRRMLEPLGIRFETDNDTEAACRFLEWRLREGDDLTTAIHRGFEALDGFYTFLMGTDTELAIVRDAFACKPAIVAETDEYVAIASEFRSLAHLPGVRNARLFEPQPQEIYTWHI